MNKEYKIKLDLNKKLYNKKMAFNQFDENVNDFYIEVTKNNEVVKDLDKSIITLVAIKPNNAVDAQFIEVKEGQIYADLKPSMCDIVGNYQAKAMIVLEGEIVTTDTINYSVNEDKIISRLNDDVVSDERFPLFTDALSRLSTIEASEEQRIVNEAERILSEENRKIEEAKRVEAELIRQHEEADRAKYDATRESNENIRKQNEEARISSENVRLENEANRIEQEANRVKAEQLRKDNYNFMTEDEERRRSEANAHKEAEVLRVQAETNRVNEEAKRRTTEQARVSAENTRVGNENVRETNETTRQTNETHRVEAETQRQNRYNSFILDAEANASNFENYTNTAKANEEERKSNELDRQSQEDRRVSNEVERISNENTRKANEVVREKNEASRQNTFTNKVNEVDKKIVELNTTKDNFVSSINTKVDTKISEIEVAKSDMTTTVSNKLNDVETRFNALTSSQQQSSEVIDARDGEVSLKARLDRDIEKAKQVYVPVEGSNISTDSSVGYAKDVEILGNTVQDTSNLADIRSVGDKVEGQELYEIPVLSRGKNLFDEMNYERFSWSGVDWNKNTLPLTSDGNYADYNGFQMNLKLKPNTTYTLKFKWRNVTGVAGQTHRYIRFQFKDVANKRYSDAINGMGGFDPNADSHYILFEFNGNSPSFVEKSISFTTPNEVLILDKLSNECCELKTNCIQLEEGTQPTPYDPYQEDKLTILSPTPLEKVGDVADRIVCKDGVWGVEKNIETYCLKDIPFTIDNSQSSHYAYTKYFDSITPRNNYFVVCNKLQKVANIFDVTVEGYALANEDKDRFRIRASKDKYSTVSELINELFIKIPVVQPQFIPLPHSQQVKLRTFANKTNISFLTEIEGTIKAQVPKSLGATVNTHTEQISNLNKELDRVKKLEESTVSTVTTESDFTTVEATSNGYFEDVKLDGKTLVNVLLSNTKISNDFSAHYPNWNIISVPKDDVTFKENTTYTFVVNITKNTTNSGLNDAIWFGDVTGGNICYTDDIKRFPCNVGQLVFTVKTASSFDGKKRAFSYQFNKNISSGIVEFDVVILEGDHTQNPPSYFEGLKSAGEDTDEIVVSSVNENLFDEDNVIFTTIGNNYGVVEKVGVGRYRYIGSSDASKNWGIAFKQVKLPPNSNFSISFKKDIKKSNDERLYIKSSSGSVILDKVVDSREFNFTTGVDDTYIFNFYCGNGTVANIEFELYDVCIKNKHSNFEYTPHQSDKKRLLFYNNETQAWEKPILREWDSIEKHANGKYYYHQRSGEVVLNGSESWYAPEWSTIESWISNNPNGFAYETHISITGKSCDTPVICNKFNSKSIPNSSSLSIGYCVLAENYLSFATNVQRTIEQWKSELQTNPVTVVYQLAQEKVYECTNIDLITYANETNYLVESGVLSPKTTLKVHSNISNVVSLLQKKVSLLESNITSYMITQNRLMLASRYNADTVSFKVDVATLRNSFEYDNDLYELILNNILVGKDNYNREYIENLIIFYWMDFIISDEMYSTLFEIIEEQHNPKIEEETPLI